MKSGLISLHEIFLERFSNLTEIPVGEKARAIAKKTSLILNVPLLLDLAMESAGFIKLQQKRYDLPLGKELPIQFRIMGKVVQPHVMGVATK